MKKFGTVSVVLLTLFAGVNVASAGFDNSNANSLIYWSPNDLSSTLVTAAPGDTVTLFALINNNNSNYGHDQGDGGYAPNWAPAIGYQIGAYWDTAAVVGSSFNWNNYPGYSGPNGQGEWIDIYNDHLYWLFASANWGEWNMWKGEVARYAHYAAWQVQSNRGVWIGGYHPYAYLYENSIVTQFQFTVREDVFDLVEGIWDVDEQGQLYQYYESSVGLEFAAWNVYENPVLLSSWYTNYEAITLRVELAGTPPGTPGDFDNNTHVDTLDIDLLCDFIRNGMAYDALYDISGDGVTGVPDGVVNMLDLDYLIRFLVETSLGNGTEYGDFNLDGKIDTTDLTRLATDYGTGDTWAKGNANRYIDLITDTTDLTILATYYGFGEPDVVPEPASAALLLIGGSAALTRRRKSKR